MTVADQRLRLGALWWSLGVILAIAVFVLGILPGAVLPTQGFNDKINHALAYIVLTVWFAGIVSSARWAWLVVGLVLLGVMVEIVQTLTPFGRTGDAKDLLANLVGIAVGLLLARAGLGRWPTWIDTRLAPRDRA